MLNVALECERVISLAKADNVKSQAGGNALKGFKASGCGAAVERQRGKFEAGHGNYSPHSPCSTKATL